MHAYIITKKKLFNTNLGYNIYNEIWLICVIVWNFGVPDARLIEMLLLPLFYHF
jgi:hypothetical protein